MERAEWLKQMRTKAETLYDQISPQYWVTFGFYENETHLATALAKPGVAIFGPTDPARNGPYGDSLREMAFKFLPDRCGHWSTIPHSAHSASFSFGLQRTRASRSVFDSFVRSAMLRSEEGSFGSPTRSARSVPAGNALGRFPEL